MIISNNDKLNINDKTFYVGGKVWANEASDYAGLLGRVTEIRTGDDKETENEGPEICCSFDAPEHDAAIRRIEVRFSKLYQMPKRIEDLSLDDVIMAPEMLEPIAEKLPDAADKLYVLSLCNDGEEGNCDVVLGVSTDRSILMRMMLDDADDRGIEVIFSDSEETKTEVHYTFEIDNDWPPYLYLEYIISEAPAYLGAKGV